MGIIISYLLVINIFGYAVVWLDKRKAQKNVWRIREKTIFIYALLGGFIGVWLSMQRFRHKTKTWYFVWGIPLIGALWSVAVFITIYLLLK